MTEQIGWRDLSVTNDEGETLDATLGEIVDAGEGGFLFKYGTWVNGVPVSIQYYFLSAPGEEPDWDTPRCPVDWAGLENAVTPYRGTKEA